MKQQAEELIRRAGNGEAEAFAQLYDVYLPKIYGYVYYRVQHKETAEDLVSLIFIKAYEELTGYVSARGTFSAWLYRIAHNVVIDHYRARQTSTPLEDVWDALADGTDIPRDLDVQAKLQDVEKIVSALPSAQRELLLLRVWDGYSYAEIAELTGKSEAACKMGVSRALSTLRASLPLLTFLSFLIPPHLWIAH